MGDRDSRERKGGVGECAGDATGREDQEAAVGMLQR